MADDDPEGFEVYAEARAAVAGEADCRLLTNQQGVGPFEVNAFQRQSDIVVQKSLREGFGLTVAEALWKKTAVIGGNVGGIPPPSRVMMARAQPSTSSTRITAARQR